MRSILLFLTAIVFCLQASAIHVQVDWPTADTDSSQMSEGGVACSFFVNMVDKDIYTFELTFSDIPDKNDSFFRVLSKDNYAEISIKSDSETLFLLDDFDNQWGVNENQRKFKFRVNSKYVKNSAFTFWTYPIPKDEQKRYFINFWNNLDSENQFYNATSHAMWGMIYNINLGKLSELQKKLNEKNVVKHPQQ